MIDFYYYDYLHMYDTSSTIFNVLFTYGYTFSIKIYCVKPVPLKFVWPSHKLRQSLKKVILIKINKKRYENTMTLWWITFAHQSLAAKGIMKISFSVLWIFNLRMQVHGCLQHKHIMVIIGRKVGRKWMAHNHQNHRWKHISTQ